MLHPRTTATAKNSAKPATRDASRQGTFTHSLKGPQNPEKTVSKLLTEAQAKAKIKSLAAQGIEIAENKSLSHAEQNARLAPIEAEIEQHMETLAFRKKNAFASFLGEAHADLSGIPGSHVGKAPNIRPSVEQAQQLYAAIKSHQPLKIELKDAASDASSATNGLLPAHLLPGIVGLRREPVRLLDHLPVTPMEGPSIEFITHASTTGSAGMVAAGGLKPQIVPNTVKTILTAKKLAAFAVENDETLMDFVGFQQYLTTELQNAIIDVENQQILSGDGTGENLLGLLNQSGILTRAFGAATETVKLDTVELAITDLRTGPAYTDPDAIVMHPTTWSKLRRTTDSQGRYLLNPDPSAAEANSLWGIPVLATTSITAGTALVANLQEGAEAFVREGLSLQVSKANLDNFQRNQTGFIYEERLNIGARRPAAIVKVTGL